MGKRIKRRASIALPNGIAQHYYYTATASVAGEVKGYFISPILDSHSHRKIVSRYSSWLWQ